MVFSSLIFLFFFLPITLVAYFSLRQELRNFFLLIVSLFFYAWGEVTFLPVMLASIFVNYFAGIFIEDRLGRLSGKIVLILGIVADLGLLSYYKYANFLADNLRAFLAALLPARWVPHWQLGAVHLPVGISFFTFHAISYLMDIYRGKVAAQRRLLDLALYISLFPQLVAGPVVRYRDVASQIINPRIITMPDFAEGIRRFIFGLGKKVLLANPVGQTANNIFALDHSTALSTPVAWLGLLCYTLQIYFDFSGYSDMAIGLGRMFGFHFLENFSHPYISRSLGEFWRRWHISLSTWFRDYLYIPLGGNRRGPTRTLFNLVTVFFLCGLWHGASWTFVIWGLLHGVFLIVERIGWETRLTRLWAPAQHAYTLLVVALGWVFFREDTLTGALAYLRVLCGGGTHASASVAGSVLVDHLNPELCWTLVAGLLCTMPVLAWLEGGRGVGGTAPVGLRANRRTLEGFWAVSGVVAQYGIFLACILNLSGGAYNPFIYFRF